MFISIEVAFAENQQQKMIRILVSSTCSLLEAIQHSSILSDFPDIDLTKNKVGIFGKLSTLDTEVKEGDRIEIYRPLIVDPKKNRKNRAKKQRAL